MRGETKFKSKERTFIKISIHSPHAGRDLHLLDFYRNLQEFQSTLPMRGETLLYPNLS